MEVLANTATRIRSRALERELRTLEGFRILVVERGELRTARAGQLAELPVRAGRGDVLLVGTRSSVTLDARRCRCELLDLAPPASWLTRARTLLSEDMREAGGFAVLRAGDGEAERLAQRMRRMSLSGPDADLLESAYGVAWAFEVVAIAHLALARAVEAAPAWAPRRRGAPDLLDALQVLSSGPLEALQLETLASRLGVSPRHASRLVRHQLGISFRDWLIQQRLARARSLLAETDLSVTDVAAEAGFGSLGHFTALFRQRVGETPSRFRARRRATGDEKHALAGMA